jgi:serine/threonine-protein kinase
MARLEEQRAEKAAAATPADIPFASGDPPGSGPHPGDDPVAPGDRVAGRFIIERELGRGGGGAVFLARDRVLDRGVAIKVLPRGVSDQNALERFEQEARAAGGLEHPNVLAVHDVGVHEGAPFIVSELLDGSTLRKTLEESRLPIARIVTLALQLAQGLAATHEKGIVHRDLKPENLFVLRDGRLKILDFGVAKLLSRGEEARKPGFRTVSGTILGTVPYMSPEQVHGSVADARSDIFAFGAILYEMLAGAPAFARASHVETGHAILAEEAPPLGSNCPRALRHLVTRCLAKDPADRIATARELVAVLEPLARLPPQAFVRPWPLRAWALAVSAVLGALIVLVSGVPDRFSRPRPAVTIKRLAVLPFRPIGPTPDREALCAGLTRTLSDRLRRVEILQKSVLVVSPADLIKERVGSADEARSAFGANLALTGTVHWQEHKIFVAASLVDTESKRVVSARDLEIEREEFPSLTSLLLQKVTEMLALETTPDARRNPDEEPAAPGVYEVYLQGQGYLQRYDRAENIDRAIASFDGALARDPKFALAHAGRAEAWLRKFHVAREVGALEQARASTERAIRLGPRLAQVHLTAGLVHEDAGEHALAIDSFEQALQMDASNVDAMRELANAYDGAGRPADAETTFQRAVRLRPGSWAACKDLAIFYNRHGRLEEALSWFQRVVALTPDNYAAYSSLGGVYLRLGRHEPAAAALQKSLALHATTVAYINLGAIRYFEERYAEASESFRKAAQLNPSDERAWGALGDALKMLPGQADEMAGAYRQAIALAERQAVLNPNDAELHSRLAMYDAYVGDRQAADTELASALRLASTDGTVLFRAALVHEELGRRLQALDAIDKALHVDYSREEIGKAPALAGLRGDPRYTRMLTSIAQGATR